MRRDIQVNTATNDIVLKSSGVNRQYSFKWVSETDLHLLGEITIPSTLDVRKLQTEGVKVEIPYTPIYKPFKIRIVRSYDESTHSPIINPVNGSEWFDIYTKLWGLQAKSMYASQLLVINSDAYIIQLDNKEGVGHIWSANKTDAVNIDANIQNRNLLLQCVPSNNYRYPISGVGLIRFLHANLSQTNLADVLQGEFQADGVTVKSAAFDSFTGDIQLELDFTEVDANI